MEKKLPDKITEEVVHSVKKRMDTPHYRVFYFGSRVQGDPGKRSDIDIGIEAPYPLPAKIFFSIQSDLEALPILQKIDLVDFQTVSDSFKQVALKNIRVIHEQ